MNLRRIKYRIDARLNGAIVEMTPGWDDSVTGFNDAWDIVREILDDEIQKGEANDVADAK